MEKIDIHTEINFFYCPATGQQILSPDDFTPSPAVVFSCLLSNGKLDHASAEIRQLFDECLKQNRKEGAHDTFEKALEELIEHKLASAASYILFIIHYPDDALYLALDMNFAVKESNEDEEIMAQLTNVEELRSRFLQYHEKKPKPEGYAVFSTDDMGVGIFNFCDNQEELHELCEAVTFMEAFEEGYEAYSQEKLRELYLAFLTNSSTLPLEVEEKELMNDLNQIFNRYCIHFMGPVKELFVPDSEFSSQLIEDFGDDPQTHPNEYLDFLSSYTWG